MLTYAFFQPDCAMKLIYEVLFLLMQNLSVKNIYK